MTAQVLLVRHGQASFGKSDYDRLSDLGHEQARVLGGALRRRDWIPDRIVCGSLRRHQETLAEISVGTGIDLDFDIDPDWNELDHVAVINAYRPAYRNMLVLKADMVRTFRPHEAFEDMFTKAIARWAGREHDGDYPETFEQFDARVHRALTSVTAGEQQRTLVVSSIGAIALLAADLLTSDRETAWRNFSLAGFNTGVTRLRVTKGAPQLLTFNEISHLETARLITNR